MMNTDRLLAYFNETFSELENSISLFDYQSFNQVPFEDSWTPGQVVQHLKLANGNFVHVLKGEVGTTERPIDEKVSVLKEIFLNFTTKLKSPDFIRPEITDYDKDQLLSAIKTIKQDIAKVIPGLDLSKTCLSFELPMIGHLTRLEAIYFVTFHTERHVNQLKNIHQYLTPSKVQDEK
jgi:hypothetical protein